MTRKTDHSPQKTYKERYDLVRHPKRIRSSDVIEGVFDNIIYYGSPDPSLIAATGSVNGIDCIILGQEKPRKGKKSKATGMVKPEGFAFGIEMLAQAEKHKIPVVTIIDTYGGDPSMDSELGGQSFLISDSISRFCDADTPTISYVIGEGGSGGALAMQIADKAFMLENAIYSVIAPESCCRIIFHRRITAGEDIEEVLPDALNILRPGVEHLKQIGMVDETLPEPEKGAHTDYEFTCNEIKRSLVKTLNEWVSKSRKGKKTFKPSTIKKLKEKRREKVLHYGEFIDDLDKLAKRRTKRKFPDKVKTIDVEQESFEIMHLIKAHLEKEGIEDTELVNCEKEWDPDKNLFKVAGGCGFISKQDYVDNFYACPKCGKGEYLSVEEHIEKICDKNTFKEIEGDLSFRKMLNGDFYNFGSYKESLEKTKEKAFSNEGLVTGTARINGKDVVLVISDLRFFGGSFGAVFGEKFKRAVDYAVEHQQPFISVCSSGGARMNEGPMSLAQMAKMNMALLDLKNEGLMYLSIITGPTTGGAYASYVTQGDILIGEEGAMVEFAGPRVVMGGGFSVDREIITTNKLYETDKIQHLVKRKELRELLSYYVRFFYAIRYPHKRRNRGRILDFTRMPD
ncbi:MAG: carboxyl transferase domain-containing protein [Bacteroidales bacterium]|nr:carboxyl transferase domain-containing protein [Bacteroidales bacterium]